MFMNEPPMYLLISRILVDLDPSSAHLCHYTVKLDTPADCLLMSAIRHVHFSRIINAVLVVITQFGS